MEIEILHTFHLEIVLTTDILLLIQHKPGLTEGIGLVSDEQSSFDMPSDLDTSGIIMENILNRAT